MGCFGCTGHSTDDSDFPRNKNSRRNANNSNKNKPHDQRQAGSSSSSCSSSSSGIDNLCSLSYVSLVSVLGFHLLEVKNASKESLRKEEASKDEELLMEVRNLSFHGGEDSKVGKAIMRAQLFTFDQVIAATGNFRSDYFLGEGGFGKVYKGFLEDTNEVVAIKQLDQDSLQGSREFAAEVLTLSTAEHPNLVKLIGFCAEDEQRLLLYEYMPLGSLENHLHGKKNSPADFISFLLYDIGDVLNFMNTDLSPDQKPLDWNTRMEIAAGAARGLEYLHVKMKPPVIYRDLKCSNILLGEGYHARLSDFGLARVGPSGDKTHVSTRVMGTYGYCAPDYAMTGQLTFKSDIYSFGVVLLELITGRKAVDYSKDRNEQYLVAWARPLFKDRRNFSQMVDPLLQGQYPMKGLYQALAVAAMCIQEQPNMRPAISDVVMALNYLTVQKYDPNNSAQSSRRSMTLSPGKGRVADRVKGF
ncbi:hypothetical protein CXB51_021210 [Gossypium anomalum]|uniref:Protein kinase domain-containing protein n=1 Tax=Gossypium anomalum TaxID=47600 RepID=A0A8J5YLW2_9ROSI|nr:hypothetical protein CXB51_021210 [Gossypium anomalum]